MDASLTPLVLVPALALALVLATAVATAGISGRQHGSLPGPSLSLGRAVPMVRLALPGRSPRRGVGAGADTLSRPQATVADAEALLTCLSNEIDVLRAEIEALRGELAPLVAAASVHVGRPDL